VFGRRGAGLADRVPPLLLAAGVAVRAVRPVAPTLEDVFMSMTRLAEPGGQER
jgi:hypothetical protein